MNDKENKINKKNIIIIVLCVVVAVLIAILILRLTSCTNQNNIGYDSGMKKIDDIKKDDDKTTLPSVSMPGWSIISIPANTKNITEGINLFNPSANEGYFDLAFEISVDIKNNGQYKSLYKSGLVSPGKTIQEITLSEPLAAGDYDSIVFIQPYLIGDKSIPLNNGQVNVRMHVE